MGWDILEAFAWLLLAGWVWQTNRRMWRMEQNISDLENGMEDD